MILYRNLIGNFMVHLIKCFIIFENVQDLLITGILIFKEYLRID